MTWFYGLCRSFEQQSPFITSLWNMGLLLSHKYTSKAKSKVKANAFPKLRASFDFYFDVAKFLPTFKSIWGFCMCGK